MPPNPVRYYANDSHFPYLPASNGQDFITFWVCGYNFRSRGPGLDRMGPIDPTGAVLAATAGQFDHDGAWLLNVIRRADGALVGFYHAEDHRCTPRTEWNSAGVAISRDDGATFTKLGQIIGEPNLCKGFGGLAGNSFAWDERRKGWLAWGGAHVFASDDPDAAPGTWRGWDTNGAFTVAMPCTNLAMLGRMPGADPNVATQAVTWNTHLGCYLMLMMRWGDARNIYVAESPDGIRWTPRGTLLTGDSGEQLSYPFLIGETAERCGREAWLVYGRAPATEPGRRIDLVRRAITIERTP